VVGMDILRYYGKDTTPGGYYFLDKPPSEELAKMWDQFDREDLNFTLITSESTHILNISKDPMKDPTAIRIMQVLFPYLRFTKPYTYLTFVLGKVYLELGMFEAAEAILKKITTKMDPYLDVAYAELGPIYNNSGRLDEAKEALEKAIRLNPKNPHHHTLLGVIYRAQRNWDQARQELEKSIDLGARDGLTYSELGSAYYSLHDSRAESTFLKALKADTEDPFAYIGLGAIYYDEYKATGIEVKLEDAIKNFGEGCKRNPKLLDWVSENAPETIVRVKATPSHKIP